MYDLQPAYDDTPLLAHPPDDKLAELQQGFTYGVCLYALAEVRVTTSSDLHDYTMGRWTQIKRQLLWHTENSLHKQHTFDPSHPRLRGLSFRFRCEEWMVFPHFDGVPNEWVERWEFNNADFVATFQKLL